MKNHNLLRFAGLTFLSVMLLLLVTGTVVIAQSSGVSGNNEISGIVRNADGPLPGAQVSILDSKRKKMLTMHDISDGQGRYDIHGMPCGTFFLVVEAEGYETLEAPFSCFEDPSEVGNRGALSGGQVKNITLQPVGTTIIPKEEIEQFPSKASNKYKKALKKMDKGDMAGAEKILDEVLAIEPGFHYARAKRGEIHKLAGRTDEAKKELAVAVEQNPLEVMGRVHLASIHIQAGELEQAAGLLEQAAEAAPNYADAWYNLGFCCSQLEGKTEQAETALLRSLELDAEANANARLLLANTYVNQKRLKDALEQMEAWLALGLDTPMTERVTQAVADLREDLDLNE